MESPSPESRSRARRILRNYRSRNYTAQQAEQECRVERQSLLTEYYRLTREISRDCAVDDSSSCGQPTALNNTHIETERLDRIRNAHGDRTTTNTFMSQQPFEDSAYPAYDATENSHQSMSETHPTPPKSEIKIPMEPTYISHGELEQPPNHHSGTYVDLAIAALEQRMIHYIDTAHEDLAIRLNGITMSCANIEKKVDKRYHPLSKPIQNNESMAKPNQNNKTMAKPNKNNKTMDGSSGRFDDTVKDLGEAISRLSASIDDLGVRFGLNGKKDEEADVYEWEKDDCLERFA